MDDHDLKRASDAMRARLKSPDAGFTERVMADVRREVRPVRRFVAVPKWSIPLAAAAMLAMWFAGRATRPSAVSGQRSAVAATSPDTVYVHFEIAAPNAQNVKLAGDFSGWQPQVNLAKNPDGTWSATVPVAVGVHRYQFVVDSTWIADPAVGGVDDGFGGRNSVMVVGPKGVVRS